MPSSSSGWCYLFLQTLFEMMQTRVTRWGGVGLNKHETEQALRDHIKPRVQLVTWRKANYKYPEGHIPVSVDWSCRWGVRPHIRRYKNGKVVNIKGYIKGPEDKPFKDSNLVVHDVKR